MRWRTANTRRKRRRYAFTFAISSDDGLHILAQRTFVSSRRGHEILAAVDWARGMSLMLGDVRGSC
jgi:hypothetical protein